MKDPAKMTREQLEKYCQSLKTMIGTLQGEIKRLTEGRKA